ncbi:MAG TPA: cohesin domain-containing protein [Pyrinomonadaceae bacterium]|jgi:hypothetical protein
MKKALYLNRKNTDNHITADSYLAVSKYALRAIIFCLCLSFFSAVAQATTFNVNNNADTIDANTSDNLCKDASGNCTLRAAIQQANALAGDDIITFAIANPSTIDLTIGEITITSNITINGTGARNLIIQRALTGVSAFRVFNISSGNINITALSIANGNAPTGADGGGIYNGGNLTLTEVTIRNNRATRGAGVMNWGTLYMTRSTINNNTAEYDGGGMFNVGGRVLNISNTTICDNTANGGGGIYGDGNTVLNNVTISNNTAGNGGGVAIFSGTAIARNTIVANNNISGGTDIAGNFASLGNNIIGKNAGAAYSSAAGDKVGTPSAPLDPKLDTLLKDNGGPTNTRALLPGSPAIDAGGNCVVTNTCSSDAPFSGALIIDQRGAGFSRQIDGDNNGTSTVDIGAFEATTSLNVSIPTTLSAKKNTTLTVPVNVTDTTGKGIISFDFTLTYDKLLFTPLTTPFDTAGTLSSGYSITVNSSTLGQLRVSGYGTAPLTGTGTLLNFKFNSIGALRSCNNLAFSNFRFNEGTPASTTTNGNACVVSGMVSGSVTYGTSTNAVADVNFTAAGLVNVTAKTNATGTYSLSNFGEGAYTVTPSKAPTTIAVSAYDASLVSQFAVGSTTLTTTQQTSADVSGNGEITSYDAGLIAQSVIGIANQSRTGTWQFIPSSRNYDNVETDQLNQDYTAVLIGDVSGNWSSAEQTSQSRGVNEDETTQFLADSVNVKLPESQAGQNAFVTIPITVGDISGRGVVSYDFDLRFDPAILQVSGDSFDTNETLSKNLTVLTNTSNPGQIRVAAFGSSVLNGNGTLLNLRLKVIGNAGTKTLLTLQQFQFNEGNPSVSKTNGQLIVNSPPAARSSFDFDGDGKTDISIFRPTVGEWWYLRSSDSKDRAFQFGTGTDKVVSADYTGDGKTDIAFFRPSSGEWFVLRSENSSYYSIPFGISTDIPVPADYDADGKDDAAVFRPSTSTWYIQKSSGGVTIQQFGTNGDIPVVADYDGDSKADLAIFRPSVGEWWYIRSIDGKDRAFQFGKNTDKPVPADYTGDGKTDIAFFRPSSGEWFVLRSENSSYYSIPFGISTDIPVVGDYDGDSKADYAVWRESDKSWYILKNSGGNKIIPFGASGDKPVPAAFRP